MISRCENPECGRPFKYLHQGKVFILQQESEVQGAHADLIEKLYFLCADCARTHTIVFRDGRPTVVPLKKENRTRSAGRPVC